MRLRNKVAVILAGDTWHPAARIAAIVGSILTAVNEGSEMVAGHVNLATSVRVLANYVIPYVVSSLGYLAAREADPDSVGEGGTTNPDQR